MYEVAEPVMSHASAQQGLSVSGWKAQHIIYADGHMHGRPIWVPTRTAKRSPIPRQPPMTALVPVPTAPERSDPGGERTELGRDVGVDALVTLVAVVLHVVRLEGDAVRDEDREVGQHREVFVVLDLLEAQVVRQLVDREEERVVGSGTHHVYCCQVCRPGPLKREPRHADL